MHVDTFTARLTFVQKLIRGSQNLEIRARDPGHAHLRTQGGFVLCECGVDEEYAGANGDGFES